MQRALKFVLPLFVALFVIAPFAATVNAQTETPSAECQQTYTVSAGDWLSTIAEKYLGSASAYTAIFEATNAAAAVDSSFTALTDPNQIEVGQKLCIPAITAVPGREAAGIYTNVGPAADASALVETIVLGGDGQVFYTLDYVGKATIVSRGTWTQEGDTVTVNLYEQAGQPTQQTMTFTVTDGNLVSTTPPSLTYTKTPANVAFYSGVYTSGRSTQDGSETLTALTLLPNGEAQMTLSTTDNPFILQTGTWTIGPNPDTGAETITVHLTQQGDQTIDETFAFQVQGTVLRGTQYNSDKWGTDLTFSKVQSPAEPETPATASQTATAQAGGAAAPEASATIEASETVTATATVQAAETVTATATAAATAEPTSASESMNVVGSYTAQLPAADAIGRVIVLDLTADGTATMTTQFIGKGEPTVEEGTYTVTDGNIVVTLGESGSAAQILTFTPDEGTIVLQDPEAAGYGSDGLTLTRTPSGNTQSASFGGVTFNFDEQLAQSAQGSQTAAVPVSEGPSLGGAMPASIRFMFNGEAPPDFVGPLTAQVVVYKAEDWTNLDSSTAATVQELQTLLTNKPADFAETIPVLPPVNAAQVFHVQTQYLDFDGGSGVGFVGYYAQDVSPVTADSIFYSFQGLTTDGKYYVAIYFPVTTTLLPADYQTGLGGMTDAAWAAQYNEYITNLESELNGLIPAAFSPNLTLIQQLINSLEISDTTLE